MHTFLANGNASTTLIQCCTGTGRDFHSPSCHFKPKGRAAKHTVLYPRSAADGFVSALASLTAPTRENLNRPVSSCENQRWRLETERKLTIQLLLTCYFLNIDIGRRGLNQMREMRKNGLSERCKYCCFNNVFA